MPRTYTERKIAWADKMRARGARADTVRSRDRLPPGQHLVDPLPVLDLGIHPAISTADFRLEINGLLEAPITLDWPALLALPQAERTSDFHCVTTWSCYDCHWAGVPTAALLDHIRPIDEARHIHITSHDGYTTNLPIEALTHPDALLAHTLGGQPLSAAHGGPARLIIPQLYGWKSAKWIKALTFLATDRPGYWEERGYSNNADPFFNDRFA